MTPLTDLAREAHAQPPTDALAALALAEDACRALAALCDRDRCDPRAVHRAVELLFGGIHRGLEAEQRNTPAPEQHRPLMRRFNGLCPVCIGVASDCICTRPTRGVVTR